MELTREIRDKRIAVARDVLAQLDREDVPLCIGHGYGWMDGSLDFYLRPDDDLRAKVDAIQAGCGVCQLGALLLSKIRLYDQVKATSIACFDDGEEESNDIDAVREDVVAALADVFNKATLDSMEAAFELYKNPAGEFGRRFEGPKERARAICRVLVDNDGEFVVPALEAV